MTMPTPSELPKNVLASADLGDEMQNLNPTKVKAKSQANMSPGFLGSGGGLAAGVVTTVGNLFGTFMGNIADDASSVTVESPEDVEEQVEDFFDTPASKLFDFFLEFLSPILQGVTSGLSGAALALANIFSGKWTQVNNAESNAVAANAAAAAANNSVQALITGGTRTIYTSSTSVLIPAGAVKVGVICMGTGGGGATGKWATDTVVRSVGGGYTYMEFPGTALAGNTYAVTIPSRPPNSTTAGQVTFGSLVSSPTNGSGSVVSSSGRLDANNSAPPKLGAWVGNPTAEAGESTELAAGGAAGSGTSAGGAGGNAATTGTALCGGAGGGGGRSQDSGSIGGTSTAGGNGGFPGGPAGAGGRTSFGTDPGGTGGLGLCAVIIWT